MSFYVSKHGGGVVACAACLLEESKSTLTVCYVVL
jgi:hypothetical protein